MYSKKIDFVFLQLCFKWCGVFKFYKKIFVCNKGKKETMVTFFCRLETLLQFLGFVTAAINLFLH